ncbi:hypothetical protein KKE03_02205 [Patescibacteria group bacterium]|nr:hypothetical protein [Patescibacteria group bacterium]
MIRERTLGYFVLFGLEKSIQAWVRFVDFAYNPHLAGSVYPRKFDYGGMYQAIKNLREKGYIELAKNDEGKILMKLTSKGKKEIEIHNILKDKKWDNKWRVVVFDIPEKHKKLRHALRWKLREWEFIPWQKSVWVSKKDIVKPLRDFIKEVGLSQWVKVLLAEDLRL